MEAEPQTTSPAQLGALQRPQPFGEAMRQEMTVTVVPSSAGSWPATDPNFAGAYLLMSGTTASGSDENMPLAEAVADAGLMQGGWRRIAPWTCDAEGRRTAQVIRVWVAEPGQLPEQIRRSA